MPIFEFECNKCKLNFDFLVRNETIPYCPSCNSKELTKKVTKFSTKLNKNTIKSNMEKFCAKCTSKNCSSCNQK